MSAESDYFFVNLSQFHLKSLNLLRNDSKLKKIQ